MNPTITAAPTTGTYTIANDRDWKATVQQALPGMVGVRPAGAR